MVLVSILGLIIGYLENWFQILEKKVLELESKLKIGL